MSADQTEREALAWSDRDLTDKWKSAATAARAAEHHFPADCLLEAVGVYEALCDQINTRPTPRTVTTVEELEALPVGAVVGSLLAGGEWLVATKNRGEDGLEDYPWSVAGHGGRYSNHGVEEHLGLPATVLTPAPAPAKRKMCPSCGGLDGSHGLVHERFPQGGGGTNKPCPKASAPVDDEALVERVARVMAAHRISGVWFPPVRCSCGEVMGEDYTDWNAWEAHVGREVRAALKAATS